MHWQMDLLRDWMAQVRKIPAVILGKPYARITSPLTGRPLGQIINVPGRITTVGLSWYSQPKGGQLPLWQIDPPSLADISGRLALQKQLTFNEPGTGKLTVSVPYEDGTIYVCPPVLVTVMSQQ